MEQNLKPEKVCKNITFVTQFFPPDFAATGQFIAEIVFTLAQAGYKVQVYTSTPAYAFEDANSPKDEFWQGAHILRSQAINFLPKRIRGKTIGSLVFFLRALFKLRHRHLRSESFFLTSAPPFLPIVGWFYHKLCKQSYICIVYDIYPEVVVQLGVFQANSWLVRLWHKINSHVWGSASTIIVLTESMKTKLISLRPTLEPKITVIPCWADGNLIKPIAKQENWFAKFHNINNFFTILYSGNLGRCHDAETLLKSIKKLNTNSGIKFVCIGDGAGRKFFTESILNGELTNVVLLPYQSKKTIPFSLTACDVSVVSMKPGFEDIIAPSKLYGMLAAGRPIVAICPANCYLVALIKEGNCGAAFVNGDVQGIVEYMLFLSKSANEVERLGKNARRYFEQNYTLNRVISKYLEILDPINDRDQTVN